MHTVKPLNGRLLENIFKKYSVVATMEEHSIIGELGSGIAEWMIKKTMENPVKLFNFGYEDICLSPSGSLKNIRSIFDLNSEFIANHLYENYNHEIY